jgi:6-phospho-beta-glucosidase
MHQRISSYMQHGETNEPITGITDVEADEGYAGVALSLIEGLENDHPVYTALNVPNENAIACMQPDDVVEVSCVVDRNGIHPQPIGDIPEPQELLMRTVKLYEKLAVKAILNRSRTLAAQALMFHPLVLSYARAEKLVDEYLSAHAAHVEVWE